MNSFFRFLFVMCCVCLVSACGKMTISEQATVSANRSIEEMHVACGRLTLNDQTACFNEHEFQFNRMTAEMVTETELRRDTVPRAWLLTMEHLNDVSNYSSFQACILQAEKDARKRAACFIQQHYWTAAWILMLEDGSWKNHPDAVIGMRMVDEELSTKKVTPYKHYQ